MSQSQPKSNRGEFALKRPTDASTCWSINDSSTINIYADNNRTLRLFYSIYEFEPRKQLQPGSRLSSTLMIISSMVGGGALALPYAMYNSGFCFALLYFIVYGFIASWTVYAVIIVGQKTNAKTFYGIAKVLWSERVAIVIEILMVLLLALASVAYLTMVKNLLPWALKVILHTDEDETVTSAKFLLPLVTIVVIWPLALMRKVSALRYASLCGFCFVIYLVVVIVVNFFDNCDTYGTGCFTERLTVPSIWMQMDFYGIGWTGHMFTIPMIIGSYTAHPTVLSIYVELRKKSPKDMWSVIWIGHCVTALMYICLSSFGYFTFLSTTKPNLLLNNYHHNILVIFGSIGFCAVSTAAVPLFTQANRRSITTLYFDLFGKETTRYSPLLSKRDKVIFSSKDEEAEHNEKVGSKMLLTPGESAFGTRRTHSVKSAKNLAEFERMLPMWANFIITFILLTIEVSISLYMTSIGTVLAFSGMLPFPIVCYVFPTLALWKLHAHYPDDEDINFKLLLISTTSTLLVCVLGVIGLLVKFKVLD